MPYYQHYLAVDQEISANYQVKHSNRCWLIHKFKKQENKKHTAFSSGLFGLFMKAVCFFIVCYILYIVQEFWEFFVMYNCMSVKICK